MPTKSICCEIGVDTGDFSQSILDIVRPVKLHLVDPWAYRTELLYTPSLYGGEKGGSQERMDERYQAVQARFAVEIESDRVRIHRNYSQKAADEFPSEYFDWVYIDGNHLYEFVLEDLKTYYPKVKPGGFLAGDDYGTPGWWKGGVEKAVDEFLGTGAVKLVKIDGDQFILKKLSSPRRDGQTWRV